MRAPNSPVVLIHSLWLTPLSWEPFFRFYENLGRQVLAPAWPGIAGSIADLRRDASALNGIGVGEAAAHYAKIIRHLSAPPIIIGHGYGGLIAQLLADRGLGVAAVAIDSIPPKGILLRSFLTAWALYPVLARVAHRSGTFLLTFRQFWQLYGNTLPESVARKIYETQVIPAPGRPIFQAALANFTPRATTTVNFANPRRPPLLFIGGGKDALVPPSLNRSIFRRHRASPSPAAYKEFPGRSHYLIAEPGWQEVADFALTWALAQAALRPS